MNLQKISTTDLHAELQRRDSAAQTLLKQRDKILAELAEIERALGDTGTVRSRGRRESVASDGSAEPRRRARNEISLGDALAQAMEVRAIITPAEAAQLVIANGYKTTSKTFNMMVSNTLAKDSRFQRVARGQYERVA